MILNVPKLKTHMKTGMTGALKNFVGIIGSKDFLPHFRAGSPSAGGDEYPDKNWLSHAASPVREFLQTRAPLWMWKLARAGARSASPLIHGGGWHGNDTLWRTIHDLVDIARNYGPGGELRSQAPYHPDAGGCDGGGRGLRSAEAASRPCGLLVWGEDPGLVDVTCATLMGFDWRKIPLLSHLCDREAAAFTVFDGQAPAMAASVRPFASPVGWVGAIERERPV